MASVDLSPSSLCFALLFGSVGLMCVQIGRRRQQARPILAGMVLMGLSLGAGSTWWSWPVAIVVCVLAFVG